MKLKLDAEGRAVINDGMPVYVKDDGTETPVDVAAMYASVRSYKDQVKTLGREATEARDRLAKFDGLDPEKVRKGQAEVETVRAELTKAYEAKVAAEADRAAKLELSLHRELVGGAFARSKFLADRVAVPAELIEAQFGRAFKVEDGKVRAYDANGNPIYSRRNPGANAEFDEALEILVDQFPAKDRILKADQKPGGGSPSGSGGGPAQRTMTRAAFEGLTPAQRVEASRSGVTLTD